jgi:hypothetical protein
LTVADRPVDHQVAEYHEKAAKHHWNGTLYVSLLPAPPGYDANIDIVSVLNDFSQRDSLEPNLQLQSTLGLTLVNNETRYRFD